MKKVKNSLKKFKIISFFLILLVIMFAFSSIVEGNNINEPVWAFSGAYVKYFEKESNVQLANGKIQHYPNETSIALYKILSVNLKNQTFSYLQSLTCPLVLYFYTQNIQNNYCNKFWNLTFNYNFREYSNETANIHQPITIFFINQKTLNELNKGFVPMNLSTVLSLDFWVSYNQETGIGSPIPPSEINANATNNLTLNINNEIYPVIKVQLNFRDNLSGMPISFGNATAYIDKYSGIIVKWNANVELLVFSPVYSWINFSIILNSTNIPMGASPQINYYFIFAVSIGVILIISISLVYLKKKKVKKDL